MANALINEALRTERLKSLVDMNKYDMVQFGKDQKFSIATKNLNSCHGVAIISRKAAILGHIAPGHKGFPLGETYAEWFTKGLVQYVTKAENRPYFEDQGTNGVVVVGFTQDQDGGTAIALPDQVEVIAQRLRDYLGQTPKVVEYGPVSWSKLGVRPDRGPQIHRYPKAHNLINENSVPMSSTSRTEAAHKPSCKRPPPWSPDYTDPPTPKMSATGGKLDAMFGGSNLDKLSKKDCYIQLIDSYRMRVEDDYKFAQDNHGLYAGEDPRPEFAEFLDLAEKRRALLPGWWNQETRAACEAMGADGSKANWADLSCAVEKSDIIDHYKDNMMPMKLRLLAEKVYGRTSRGIVTLARQARHSLCLHLVGYDCRHETQKHRTSSNMPSMGPHRDSSPDPLAMSQNASSPLKAKNRQTPSRKALSTTTSNIRAHDIHITAPGLANLRLDSPVRDTETKENQPSPWQIRVTVQAEQHPQQVGSSVPQCSPHKYFAERSFTTTVPLKGEDEASPVRRKNKATPKKSRSSLERRPPSKSPTNRRSKQQGELSVGTSHGKPSPSPKPGRGRPRKSVGPSESSSQYDQEKNVNQSPGPSSADRRSESSCLPSGSHKVVPDDTERESQNLEEQLEEFDSIIESEGFSMVSVSSLPSAQGSSGMIPRSEYALRRSPRSSTKRHVTPSDLDHSPLPPPAPKVRAEQQPTRELNKPTSGTPKLARVVRAGIALQGVLSPARQRHNQATLAPWLSHSSPMSSTSSPKERLDHLFNGFGPSTCRELRAGLRLGEELAKRMSPEFNRSSQQASEDVFAPDLGVRYPELPATATEQYSLKVPYAAMTKVPSMANTQLPSPATSEASGEDDKMSWKYDTLQSNAVRAHFGKAETTEANDSTNQSILEREAQYQRERDAISKQIEEADPSQVVVIDSDDESESNLEETYGYDGDIWQEEAQIHSKPPSSSDVPPIFLQNEPRKPRRSQIPSPWMRKTQDIQSSSPAPNDSDLFWQPSHAGVAKENNSGTFKSSLFRSPKSSISGLNADGAKDDVEPSSSSDNPNVTLQTSPPSPINGEETHVEIQIPQQQGQTILNYSFNDSDQEDSTYEPEDSDDSFSDESLDDDDEDIESTLLSHHYMQDDDITSPFNETTQEDISDAQTPASSKSAIFEDVPELTTPRTPSCLAKIPRASSSKKVRFTAETKPLDSLPAPPLPPASSSWFTRVTSLIPTWTTNSTNSTSTSLSSAALIPLPTKPKKIIHLPTLDTGPLPSYMPWLPAHWWALIHITRQISASPSSYPYDSKSLSASWLGAVVSVNGWRKTVTKSDCTTVERFMRTLYQRGTFKGVEEALMNAGRGGGRQWGKARGEWIDRRTVLSAVVAQWAVDVQDG
ncbi:MAG: hypothetical protein Q9169_007347, partial [Polycauliona sp. 2 TL-2023]